jgi:hypothetical protein
MCSDRARGQFHEKELAMRNSMKWMCAVLALALFVPMGCKSKQEKIQDKMIGVINDMADLLAGIKSNADFVAAKPKLELLGARMKDITNEAKALPKPSTDEDKKLSKELEERSKTASNRIATEMQRLAGIGVSPMDLAEAMHMGSSPMMDD